jgi:ABC-2 type transport system permease protein
MARIWHVYLRWQRDRIRSTLAWSLGLAATVALTAAFYPSLEGLMGSLSVEEGGGMASLMGLTGGIDPSSPLGFVWSNLYANVVPMTLMALGISLGTSAIAGDEEGGTLEYLLSKPVTRVQVAIARYAGVVTILFVASAISGLALLIAPFFDLTADFTSTAADGTAVVSPGLGIGNVAAGTVAAFAVGLGIGSVAFLLGTATGRKGLSTGIAAAIAVAGYLLYTLSNVTGSLEWATWLSPWRWYVGDAMFIDGLTADVLLPVVLAAVCVVAARWLFQRRDLKS